jgi:hypothetical protein
MSGPGLVWERPDSLVLQKRNVKAKFRCPLPGKVEMSAFAV